MSSILTRLTRRKPIAELVAEEDQPNSLKRVLGAGDLVMLAIGAVIGAGIFSSIGTAAAGEIRATGEVVRYGAGPALVIASSCSAACARWRRCATPSSRR